MPSSPAPSPPPPEPHGPCVPMKAYEDALAEIQELKKKLKIKTLGESRAKRQAEYFKNMAASRKNGQVLSKKAKKDITRNMLAKQYSKGVIDRIVGNKKKSHCYSNKGLHMSQSAACF